MSLKESTIHRKLDAKFKIGGMEAPDILGVLIFAAIMNLFFGRSSFAFIFIIVIPLILLVTLYFGKRGKPDNYLVHLAKYYLTKGYYSAGIDQEDKKTALNQRIYGKSN